MAGNFKNSAAYTFALYGAVGIQFAASVVAGLIIGRWIDNKFLISPLFTIIGTILGTVGGMLNLVKTLKWNEKRNSKDRNS